MASSSTLGSRPPDYDDEALKGSFEARLLPELRKLLFCDKASDVTIICDGERIPAHSVVLRTQSTFFNGALSIEMKEKLEGVITLPESSRIVRSMLSFLYTNNYMSPASHSHTQKMMHHLHIYIAADKYGIPALQQRAKRILSNYLDSTKSGSLSKQAAPSDSSDEPDHFFHLVRFLYENTHDQSDPLRCKVVDTARAIWVKQHTATQQELWIQLFGQVPAFAYELCMSCSTSAAPSSINDTGYLLCSTFAAQPGFTVMTFIKSACEPPNSRCGHCGQPGYMYDDGYYLWRKRSL